MKSHQLNTEKVKPDMCTATILFSNSVMIMMFYSIFKPVKQIDLNSINTRLSNGAINSFTMEKQH